MIKVRYVSPKWLKVTAYHAFTSVDKRERLAEMAKVLRISTRACKSYASGDRVLPSTIEDLFINRFGLPPEDGWIELEVLKPKTRDRNRAKKNLERYAQSVADERQRVEGNLWRPKAESHARALAEQVLGHRLSEFTQSLTTGELIQINKSLDHDEALQRHPDNFFVLQEVEDWVARCNTCYLVGAIDYKMQEINGLVFKVTCGTGSYRVGG
jgi:hypothetical protein